mmetsp:Transcript_17455/g.16919  ORF Transcript_17455/g.16919 Transcript_17455/m.16919 type:complete len:109 (-) Transcript_17455:200-526(-)
MSSQKGLVRRIDVWHTRDRITCGTVFFDNMSCFSYTHLQCSTGGDETIAAKRSCDFFVRNFDIAVWSCHADNGIFAEKQFRDEVSVPNQPSLFAAPVLRIRTALWRFI